MSDILIRYAKLSVWDDKENSVFESEDGQRIHFEFRKDVKSYCNSMAVRVYGMSKEDSEPVLTHGFSVELEAGDNAYHGVMFRGNIIDGFYFNGDTPYLQVNCLDGDAFYNSYVSMSVGKGELLSNIAAMCAQRCSSPVTVGRISTAASKVRLPRGCVLFGQTSDIMDSLAKQINGVWYVNDERLYLLTEDDMQVGSQIRVDSEDLVGVPIVDAWSATFGHHIDSRLLVGSSVSFDSEDTTYGVYRIVSMSAVGDNYEGDWKLTAYALKQDGKSPSMTAATTNIWR